MAIGPIHTWARVGVGRAERAEGRSAGAARAGKRARRSGAQPGLDEVEKPVTAHGWDASWRWSFHCDGLALMAHGGGRVEPLPDDLARNRPGDAVRRKIRELQPNPVLRLIDRWRPGSEIRSWVDGLTGEQLTGRRLSRLRARGWRTLHAIQWPSGADIDHLAIGPAGVFSINSKRHPGKAVWYGDTAITVNGAPTRHIAVSQSEARRVSRVLSRRCGVDVPVRPVISVVHASKLTVKGTNPPVLVLAVEDLDRVLSGLSPLLSLEQVAHIYGWARRADTWTG